MTLDTRVALKSGDAETLFMHLRKLIGTPDDVPIERGNAYTGPFQRMSNPIGIGLPGILEVEFCPDGPMLNLSDCGWTGSDGVYHPETDEDREWREADPTQNGWAAMEVSFDTAYGYRADNGARCDDLHAWFVLEVGKWATDRGIDWQWQNEYTGEWHHEDRVEAALAFGDAIAGKPGSTVPRDPERPVSEAQTWFNDVVKPAIVAKIGAENISWL